jgi:acyl-coenzyme A synthetase/AMP-(fatty) acid ligase
MWIDFLLNVFQQHRDDDAMVWHDRTFSYGQLLERIEPSRTKIAGEIPPGAVVALEADYSPGAVGMWLALAEQGCVLVPLSRGAWPQSDGLLDMAQAEWRIRIDDEDTVQIERVQRRAEHPFYTTLRQESHPGLVLFSSGSTGQCKAAVHDLSRLLEKYHQPRRRVRTIPLLLFDHIGGINTMLYALANGGCLVVAEGRSPDVVLAAVERHRVELLPTSPTFLNLMLLSEAHRRHDLASLRTITYGTEPMPEATLARLHRLLPEVRLVQTYGLSEVGILPSKSKDSDSLWVKLGGEGFQTRVVDGILQIKARSAMLGYLNAPSPFTDDGWLLTGDAVLEDGEYFRILGRQSELINVGGRKVYPAEVEGVIQELDNVAEVTVYGQRNPIVGQIVCARVTLRSDESPQEFRRRLLRFCQERLEAFKTPVKTEIVAGPQHGSRMKRILPPNTPDGGLLLDS